MKDSSSYLKESELATQQCQLLLQVITKKRSKDGLKLHLL